MNKFEIYHLQRIENKDHILIQEITKVNRALDQSIIQCYTTSKEHELKINDDYVPLSSTEFIENKCNAVKAAWDQGLYIHVANVKAKTIDKAIVATNNINGYWFMKNLKNVDIINNPTRSTQSYDLVVIDGRLIFINTVGFYDVEAGCILKYDKNGIQVTKK